MKEVSPTRQPTYSRRSYAKRPHRRDHIASLSIFKEHQSSRSMIRKCHKSRLPRECQSPIIRISFSHAESHADPASCDGRDSSRGLFTVVDKPRNKINGLCERSMIRTLDIATFSLITNRPAFTFIYIYQND